MPRLMVVGTAGPLWDDILKVDTPKTIKRSSSTRKPRTLVGSPMCEINFHIDPYDIVGFCPPTISQHAPYFRCAHVSGQNQHTAL